MKTLKIASALTILGIAGSVPAVAQPAAGSSVPPLLTLRQAVKEALAGNDRTLAARDAAEEAALALRIARAAFEPQVLPNIAGAIGQADIGNQSYGIGFSQRFTTGTLLHGNVGAVNVRNQLGLYYLADTTLTVSQPLLRGFGREMTRLPVTSAEARVADAGREWLRTEREVTLDVAASYYSIVAGEAIVEVARKSLDRAGELAAAAEAKLKAGLVSQLDVLRARQLVTQAEVGVLEAESGCQDATDRLRTLLGRGPDYAFRVEAALPASTEAVPEAKAVETALQGRPEIQQAAEAILESERAVRAASNQLRPQLDLGLTVMRQATGDSLRAAFGLDHFRLATYAMFSVPVVRTTEEAEYRKATLGRDRRRRELDTLKAKVVQEVRSALRRQERALRGVELAAAGADLARKETEVARLRYQRGLSNNLDVVNAEANLLAAESRRVAAAADLAVARLVVKAAMATLDPGKDIE